MYESQSNLKIPQMATWVSLIKQKVIENFFFYNVNISIYQNHYKLQIQSIIKNLYFMVIYRTKVARCYVQGVIGARVV